MTICEQCGRIHSAVQPDSRFCSSVCQLQHGQYMEAVGFTQDGVLTYIDCVRTSADYLAEHLLSIARRSTKLLQDAERLEEDEQLEKFSEFITTLAAGNSTAEQVHQAVHPTFQLGTLIMTLAGRWNLFFNST